jgi:hypothetical protein
MHYRVSFQGPKASVAGIIPKSLVRASAMVTTATLGCHSVTITLTPNFINMGQLIRSRDVQTQNELMGLFSLLKNRGCPKQGA